MTNKPSKKIIIAQIFLIFVLPIFLLYFEIFPTNWRFILLSISSLLIYGIIKREDWTFQEMGIRHDNFKKALPFYLVFTILGILFLFFLDNLFQIEPVLNKIFIIKTWIFFLPISFFQEFAFRSFLLPRLQLLYRNKFYVIFINAILFTLIHVIYGNLIIILPLTFISGLLFAYLYYKYPNLVLVSISHSILNVIAVLLGFFTVS